MARPTSYNQEMQDRADNYLDGMYIDEGHVVPSNTGLSLYLGVARETLQNWGESNPEFLVTLGSIKAKQKILLIANGLNSEFNSNITKLMLGNHGLSEKNQTELTGKDGAPLGGLFQVELVDAKPKQD